MNGDNKIYSILSNERNRMKKKYSGTAAILKEGHHALTNIKLLFTISTS